MHAVYLYPRGYAAYRRTRRDGSNCILSSGTSRRSADDDQYQLCDHHADCGALDGAGGGCAVCMFFFRPYLYLSVRGILHRGIGAAFSWPALLCRRQPLGCHRPRHGGRLCCENERARCFGRGDCPGPASLYSNHRAMVYGGQPRPSAPWRTYFRRSRYFW